jgi:pSer/pThr/pTyr-binding forkhead associated (FHA) protein
MKICPNCSFENIEGYMFCEDCGEDITHVESKHAKPGFAAPIPQEPLLILRVQTTNRPIVIQLHRLTTLGRYDEDRAQQPDIDLTMYNALEKGVSSLHASIQHSQDGVWLQDAGSTNGTYLNGRRLTANQNYIVRDGDEIQLGRLVTHIQFQGDI